MNKQNLPLLLLMLAGGPVTDCVQAGTLFPDPPGGWTYLYSGDQLTVGEADSGWTSLDGTWTHDNGSDEWDGSQLGGTFGPGNSPGGASLGTQAGTAYLRMQDTGDPRDYSYSDPGSNRKVYLGHNIGSDIDPTKALTIMDTGVTLTFRARVPTLEKAGPPLDSLHRDGQQASGVQSYPTNGDGYVTSDGGKGNFVIRQGGDGSTEHPAAAIAFSFTQTTDTTGGNPTTGQAGFAGLTFNEFNGNVPSANVNFGQGSKTNVVAFDPTDWHEVYIVIRDDPANIGTHEAFIFVDGNLRPVVYKITGGTGSDMNDSFLALGGSATPQNWALDVDWFGYKDEQVFPPGAQLPPSIFGITPANGAMFSAAGSGLQFSTSALMPTNTLPGFGIKVTLNGQDVSGQLVMTGNDSSKSRSVTFNALQPNTYYSASYIITDSGGLSTTNEISFDTFVEAQTKVLEAEDYNFGSGQFVDNPPAGQYAGSPGTEGVDFHDTTSSSLGTYRTDEVDTAATTDAARAKFLNSSQTDYQIGTIGQGEWWNYTSSLTNPPYNVWLRYASTAAQEVRLDRVTGNRTQPNQAVEYLGTFILPSSGSLNGFAYASLKGLLDQVVALPLSGETTLRLTALGADDNLALNFLFLLPAGTAPTQPTVSVSPTAGSTGVAPDTTIELAISDGATPVDKNTVKLSIDGAEVPAVVNKTGGITSVKYVPTTLWAAGSTRSLNVSFNDGSARSFDWSFSVLNYPVLTPAMKVTNASTPGFLWRLHQNEGNQDTSVQKAESALSGSLGLPNLADANSQGPASGVGTPANPGNATMTFTIPTVINVGQDTAANEGNFTPDEQMPGIPGTSGSTDGIAVEIKAFIELPKGLVRMGVNSDDGFRTTAGFLNDSPLVLGILDGGRSAEDSIFLFGVEEAGVYAFRTIYFEGNGGAALEWFLVKPDGTKVLINDTTSGGPRAYQQGTVPSMPAQVTLTYQVTSNGRIMLQWNSGTLQSASQAGGPYTAVPNATSPFEVNPADPPQKYYRVLVR